MITTEVIILQNSDDDDTVEKEESVLLPVLNAKSKLTVNRIKQFLLSINIIS